MSAAASKVYDGRANGVTKIDRKAGGRAVLMGQVPMTLASVPVTLFIPHYPAEVPPVGEEGGREGEG